MPLSAKFGPIGEANWVSFMVVASVPVGVFTEASVVRLAKPASFMPPSAAASAAVSTPASDFVIL